MLAIVYFFFNDTATTEIYTLSLHDALPICAGDLVHPGGELDVLVDRQVGVKREELRHVPDAPLDPLSVGRQRSEEHTSELQSRQYLVCRLLLEKKKKSMHIMKPAQHAVISR